MIRRTLATLALAAAVSACGGGGAAPVTGGPSTDGLASLTLTHPEGAVQVGDTLVMQVEAKDGNGQTVAGAQPQFTSSDATVATVDAAGVVRGVKAGAATIQATLTAGGVTRSATFAIAVLAPSQPPAQSIAAFTLNPATATLIPGAWIQFEPVATDASGARVTTLPTVAWTLADPSRATISAGRVTAAAAGSTTVTASFTAEGRTWTATATVVVTAPTPPPPPASVTVQGIEDAFSPSAVTIPVGGTVTWTMVDEEHDVTWTGAAPAGGNTGRIDDDESASRTFSQPGTYAYVCERHDGEHGGTVTVQGAQEAVLTSVRITPAGGSVAVGGTLQLAATPLDQLGREMTGVAAAQWSSANTAAATVGPTGAVTGLAPGTAAITARITHGGTAREATVSVTVTTGGTTPPPPPPPGPPSTATVTTPGESFSPATVTIAAGGTVTWQFTGSTRHNVTFSGTAPPGGNIPDTNAGSTAQRQFTTAGTYAYSCTRHDGMNGTVVVQP